MLKIKFKNSLAVCASQVTSNPPPFFLGYSATLVAAGVCSASNCPKL